MLTKNNAKTLKKVLIAIKDFPEIIVIDTGSTDKTVEIAKSFPNVTFFSSPFSGFGILRNVGAKMANHDWIFALDSDEVVTNALAEEILSLSLQPDTIYEIPFENFFQGKQVKCCGWYPESHIRIYNRKKTSFDEAFVHEGLLQNGCKVEKLTHTIHHTPYQGVDDFLVKMHRYSSLFAKQHKGKKKSSFLKALLHGGAAFFKSYLLKKGLFHGSTGFFISSYNASTAFYKYLKLMEENKKHHANPPSSPQSTT